MWGAELDTAATDAFFDGISTAATDAVRPAAQAAAQVLYDEARMRVPVGAPRVGPGGKVFPGGTLRDSLYQVFSADNSGSARAVYHVSWNARKAPHGHLVEWGHWQPYRIVRYSNGRHVTLTAEKLPTPLWVPAHSFIRAAHDAKGGAAGAAGQAEFLRRIGGLT